MRIFSREVGAEGERKERKGKKKKKKNKNKNKPVMKRESMR